MAASSLSPELLQVLSFIVKLVLIFLIVRGIIAIVEDKNSSNKKN